MVTKERVVNQYFEIIEKYDVLLDQRFVKFIIEYCNENINIFFDSLKEYIGVKDENVILSVQYKKDDYINERKNFIIKTFFNIDEIIKFLIIIVNDSKLIEDKNNKFHNLMLNIFINYIIKKINLTI